MRLSLDFGNGIGKRTVELPNTTEEDYALVEAYFTPLINSTRVKLREATADAFAFAIDRCPYENPSDLWHHVLYRIYCREKKGWSRWLRN